MKLRILGSAIEDLNQGRNFYELQHKGVGAYIILVYRVLDLRRNPAAIRDELEASFSSSE